MNHTCINQIENRQKYKLTVRASQGQVVSRRTPIRDCAHVHVTDATSLPLKTKMKQTYQRMILMRLVVDKSAAYIPGGGFTGSGTSSVVTKGLALQT